MSLTAAPTPEQRLERLTTAAPAITVAGVSKSFRLPHQQFSTLKERALHPRRANTYDTLHAVTDVDLEIVEGEFFGIVGRNGSGKSTLLKCLAGIYDVDRGEIEVHGRLSPFIELGVGFNPELTARDNVIINAIMLGLTRREARERFDDIVEFAGLEEFLDLRLKNYSSGMAVRLAFSVAIQVDADVLLVDEVLAVGDLAFQQKCYGEFQRLKEEGKTIVFVTHDMGMVERFCDRAMLLERGDVVDIGQPARVARKYNELNFGRSVGRGDGSDERFGDQRAAEIRAGWFEDDDGERIESLSVGEPCRFCLEVAFHEDVVDPSIGVTLRNQPGHAIFATRYGQNGEPPLGAFAPGDVLTVRLRFDNHLAPSIYSATPIITDNGGVDAYDLRENLTSLIIYGTNPGGAVALLPHDFEIERGMSTVVAPRKPSHGPSAFGGDGRRFVNLTVMLAVTDFKLKFFGSALGYFWSLMRPLMLFGVLYFVFNNVLKFGTAVEFYPVYLLTSIVLWTFFAETTSAGVTALIARESLLRKMRFPRMVIPLSVALTALFNLGMNLIAVFVFALISGVRPHWGWLGFPLLVAALVLLATGFAMLLSALYVRYRDISPIWDVVLQILFYASPILYVIGTVPANLQAIMMCNPIATILTQMRKWLLDPSAPSAAQAIGGLPRLLIPFGICAAIFALGLWFFHREAPRIAENL